MYKRIGMSNESILHTTSAALLPLLFKPFAISMAGRLHISHTATRLGFFLAFVFLLTMAHGIKNAASNIQYFSLFSLAISFCLISNTRPSALSTPQLQQLTLRGENAPSPTKLLYSPLWAAIVMFAGVLEVYTRQPRTSWGRIVRSSWPFPCFLFPCTITSAPYATGAPRHATSTHFSPQNLLLRLWPTN